MARWFVSGVAMLYVGYPKLTPTERLAHQPALPAGCCAELPDHWAQQPLKALHLFAWLMRVFRVAASMRSH
ncbi:hypothetical protein I8746_05950 [Pseudomonas sp. USTB-Z]|jgi:hypothetical protein|nr:hypothetical protein [Pseudomonas sp. USTB-Z]